MCVTNIHAMITFGQINDISKGLRGKIPALKPNDSAEYKLLNIRKDPENPGQWIIPSMVIIPSRTQVVDGDEVRDIAYIRRVDSKATETGRKEVPEYPEIAFVRENAGSIILSGSDPAHKLLHEYLFLCPLNENSPVRDRNTTPMYRYVDVNAEAEASLTEMDEQLRAMTFVGTITPAKGLFDYAYLVTGIDTKDERVARARLGKVAQDNPKLFFSIVESMDAKIKVVFMRAMAENVIGYDAQTGQVRWAKTKETICTISTAVTDRPAAFLIWARASAQNMAVIETIEAVLAKHKAKE